MSLIAKSAYFTMCGRSDSHGHIYLADGFQSPLIISREGGLLALDVYIKAKRVSHDEASIIHDQIEASPLPEEMSVMDMNAALSDIEFRDVIRGDRRADQGSFSHVCDSPVSFGPRHLGDQH